MSDHNGVPDFHEKAKAEWDLLPEDERFRLGWEPLGLYDEAKKVWDNAHNLAIRPDGYLRDMLNRGREGWVESRCKDLEAAWLQGVTDAGVF